MKGHSRPMARSSWVLVLGLLLASPCLTFAQPDDGADGGQPAAAPKTPEAPRGGASATPTPHRESDTEAEPQVAPPPHAADDEAGVEPEPSAPHVEPAAPDRATEGAEEAAGEAPPEGLPIIDELVEPEASSILPQPEAAAAQARPDRIAARLESLAEMAASPATARTPSARAATDEIIDEFGREAAMGLARVQTDLYQAAVRLSELQSAAEDIAHSGATVPRRVMDGTLPVSTAKQEVERLAGLQAEYDGAYDELLRQRDEARRLARRYREEVEAATQQLGRLRGTRNVDAALASLNRRAELADRLAGEWGKSMRLASDNARQAAEAVAAIQEVIGTAYKRALTYRTDDRVTGDALAAGLSDLGVLLTHAFTKPADGPVYLYGWAWHLMLGALLLALGGLAGEGLMRLHGGRLAPSADAPRHRVAAALARALVGFTFATAATLSADLPPDSTAFYLALTGAVSALYVGVAAMRAVPDSTWAEGWEREAWRRTTRWALVLGAAHAVFLPVCTGLRLAEYPRADVVIGLEFVFGLLCAMALLGLFGRAGSLALLGRMDDRCARWLVAHAALLRLLALSGVAALLAIHWLGWVNLARFLGRGLPLSVLWLALAIAMRPIRARWKAHLEEAASRPHADPWLGWVPMITNVAWFALGCLYLMWAWNLRLHHINAALTALAQPTIAIKGTHVSIASAARGTVVAAVFVIVGRLLRNWLRGTPVLTRIDAGGRYAVSTAVYYLLVILGVLFGLLSAGFELSILTVFAGVTGLAVGFGSQDLAKNFISGIIILLDRSVNVGDYIIVGTTEGTIHDISIRCTTLHTPDNRVVIVPNSILVAQQFTNATLNDRRCRIALDVNVTPDSDPDTVTEILRAAAVSHPDVLSDPSPQVWMSKLTAASQAFQLVAWTDKIERQGEILGRLTIHVWRELKAHGIGLV